MVSNKKFTKFLIIAIALFIPFSFNIVNAQSSSYVTFNINESFDLNDRLQVQSVLVKTEPNIYFYIEKSWWDLQSFQSQSDVLSNLNNLSSEFNSSIYPKLTSVFGSEWKPGVDGDNKIVVLLHLMKSEVGGYFNSADEYLKLQVPSSNEREMIYISIDQVSNLEKLKVLMAHEFVHMITFNQKDRLRGSQEEIWLNEARADYASTILGYDNVYFGSNLERRVKDFLEKPSDSLTEWQEVKYDYASVNVFFHYLVDHYGINILSDSLKSKLVGINSINEILKSNGYNEDFAQIFTNWTVAIALNNCSLDIKYCYLNKNLTNLRVSPTLNFLPFSGSSSLSVTNITKNWSGNWQKIIGGNGDLKLEFESLPGLNFSIPYIIFDKDNNYSVNFLKLDGNGKGEININYFGTKYNSLTIIPSLQNKIFGFNGFEFTYPYTFKISIAGAVSKNDTDQVLIVKLLGQIDKLKKQIAELQSQIGGQVSINNPCSSIDINLYFGVQGNQVKCLQKFLKLQGVNIYPEGLTTGYFGNLTRSAVIRFQEKYKSEILAPLGLTNGTGFVGSSTRQKINELSK